MNDATSHPRLRKAAALVAALLLAGLAFGIGLPWIIVDATPQVETLWAREIQIHPPTMTLSPLSFSKRAPGSNAAR